MVNEITKIVRIEDDIRPIIVQFQNSELQEGVEEKLHTGVFKNGNNKKVVALATRNILYSGEVNEQDDELHNRFLLISNRKSGRVKLVSVDKTIVTPKFSLKKKTESTILNANASISQLNKQFGSKKIKRITEQKERYKMNIEDVKEQLEQTVAGIELNESETTFVDNTESSYRPPINRNASNKEDVYNLYDIVSEDTLNSLEQEASHVLSSDLAEIELTPLVNEQLSILQNSSADDVLEKAKVLIYLDYLMKYITKPAKTITKRFVICPTSTDVNSYILDNYSVTSNTGRTRPISMRDKAVCAVLVLTMLTCNYEINLESIGKNIKVGVKKLQEIGRILGFSSNIKNKGFMILKVPVPPPVTISPRKRKR